MIWADLSHRSPEKETDLISSTGFTYTVFVQWAAVTTQFFSMRVPPQKCLLDPGLKEAWIDAWYDLSPECHHL